MSKKTKEEYLWTEKYRPQVLSDIILPARLMDRFAQGVDTNLIFSGSAGTGKTTLAKILGVDRSCKVMNASLDNGVDNIREDVVDYASSQSMKHIGKKKLLILDESDNLSEAAQKGLRGAIESFHKNCIFIFTANQPAKILDPIKSRCEVIDFNFSDEEQKEVLIKYATRIPQILKLEGYTITKEALRHVLKIHYPDMRGILTALQAVSNLVKVGEEIQLQHVSAIKSSEHEELYDFLMRETKHSEVYRFIKAKYQNKESQALQALGSDFCKYLALKNKEEKIGQLSIASHKYNYESQNSIDPFITLLALCVNITEIMKS